MAFKDFSNKLYIKTVDTSEAIRMGSFSLLTSGELSFIKVLMHAKGTLGGSEQFRVNIYSDEATQDLIFSSDWMDISDIVDEDGVTSTGNWLGWIRSDFDRQNLNANLTYYPTISLQNYTRNADTFYIGFARDFPHPIFDNGEDLFYDHPIAMQIFTYTERT